MKIITPDFENKINKRIIAPAIDGDFVKASKGITSVIDELYKAIPDNKRISYGRVFTIKTMSRYLFDSIEERKISTFTIASAIYESGNEYIPRCTALGILSLHGLTGYKKVLPFFKQSASSPEWDEREISQMFFRRLIKKYPREIKDFLLELAKSKDPLLRRFTAEALRPVVENKWFYKNPDYPLSVIRLLFMESDPYPRTAVGNNLSDLAKKLPDIVYGLVDELVMSGDKNSYWIAYRACRNLVKEDPIKVMDLLKVDEYKYKGRVHRRNEHKKNYC